MKASARSNYRVEIPIEIFHHIGPLTNEDYVKMGHEILTEIRKSIPGAGSIVWDTLWECESCENVIEDEDEVRCYHCDNLMCIGCDCNGKENAYICETCWKEGKR